MEIRKVAVLGAGVMGQGIAAHLANAGVPSLLFDIPPKEGADPRALAKAGIANVSKLKPAALFQASDLARITPCEYEADKARLAECDLIIEVVAEVIGIKRKVFGWVEANRRPGSIVASNTSGLSISLMGESMSEDMRQHLLVLHFFNPVRYMRLLELVPHPECKPEILAAVADFGERRLGKGIVYAKDTSAFIANRIGTFGMVSIFKRMAEEGLNVEQVDAIFGKPMGRPDSAVFRTADLVGLDTLAHVIDGVYSGAPDDANRDWFTVPSYVKDLIAKGALGDKSGFGFYKKVKPPGGGKSEIFALDLTTLEYKPATKVRMDCLGAARGAETSAEKAKIIVNSQDAGGRMAWKCTADVLIYAAERVGEIADDIVNIDNAMKWGFRWEHGPFESWDNLGVAETVARMEGEGRTVPAWVKDMLASGRTKFYDRVDGKRTFFGKGVEAVPQNPAHLFLDDLRAQGREVARNVSASLLDLGDGVLCLEFHSKMNALDDQIFPMYQQALEWLDADKYDALVVGNEGAPAGMAPAFCAGANLLMVLMFAVQNDWKGLEGAIRSMQDGLMAAKHHRKPVVTAPHGLALGGGVEVTMHSAATVAGSELYAGLVELGVGVIPAGGGCKEMLSRFLGDQPQGAAFDSNPFVQEAFKNIATARVSMSAREAQGMGYLRPRDKVVMDPSRLLWEAKRTALGLVVGGWEPPERKSFKLPGASGRAAIELYLYQMHQGGFVTDHDVTVAKKLAYVLTGGDCASGAVRTEQDILDLEREAFLSLCGTPETQARLQAMLTTGKPLRN